MPAPRPGFREHVRPLLGSIALHVGIALALGVAALFQFAPETPAVKTIEAYVVRAPEGARPPRTTAPERPPVTVPEPPPVTVPEPEVEPEPPVPIPDPAEAERAAEERRVQQQRETAEKEMAERRAAEQRRADEARKAEAAAAAKRKAEQQAEERRKFEAQAKARAEAEARKKAEAEARRKAEAELADRAAREADLDRQLAAEGRRQDPTLMSRYVADITASIQRSWNRPPTARPGIKCTVYVTQVPGGAVTDARVGTCNGDEAVRQSIVSAVLRASPLPAPPDPALFARKLELVFQPDE